MINGILSVIGIVAIAITVVLVIAYFIDEHEKLETCFWRIDREKEDITELFKITKDIYEKLKKDEVNDE